MRKACLLVTLGVVLLSALAYAGGSEKREKEKEGMKPALLVIDIQNEYLPYMVEEGKDYALMVINAAISLFREHDLPIIRVYHTEPDYGPAPGSEGFEFPSSTAIEDGDPKIVKNYASAFKKTELEDVLRDLECNTLFLCGLSATGCVLATYHGAVDSDFDVFMIKNALMSQNATHTDFIEDICETVSYKTLTVMLK